MRQVVRDNFERFNGPLEGILRYMYTDAEPPSSANPSGIVTTAMGFALFTAQDALQLDWVMPDGTPATSAQVIASWQAVHDGPANSSVHADKIAGNVVRLTDAGVTKATDMRIAQFEPTIREGFPAYDDWNAYAQMATWSLSWAMGSAFWKTFPTLDAALNASPPNFAAAAPSSFVDTKGATISNPGGESLGDFHGTGIATRLTETRMLWVYAQKVESAGGDPDEFNWPDGPTRLDLFGGGLVTPIVALVTGLGMLAAAVRG